MSDNPVETTATEQTASNPVPATTAAPAPDVEKIEKAAYNRAMREAQSKHDQQTARLHKEYQARERELKLAAAARLQKAGYEPETVFGDVEVLQKARQFDELSAQAAQASEWESYVGGVAEAYGLTASDARLQGAVSAQDLQAKAKAAMQADAGKAKEEALKEARVVQNKAAEKQIASGELETLGGAPGGQVRTDLMGEYKKALAKVAGNIQAVTKLQTEYRKKGLKL